MSHSDITKEQLDILDINSTFSEEYFERRKIKRNICSVYKRTLSYQLQHCLCCGTENESSIIKWGFKKVHYLLNDMAEFKTYLELKKQRFFCKSCGQTFLAEDTITDRHCWISNRVKLSIAERLTEPLMMGFISHLKHVSVMQLKLFDCKNKIILLDFPHQRHLTNSQYNTVERSIL
ncbi:transposase [Enterococcus sp. PF1-24]|uniref:transposase family protein n=1 Tax=unclassified Enterococcus TaxID=2608891 RepID=UPI0024770091|nr:MULTISPECIES: transposase family protein [unclassified Enterococcus]MDH6363688.1 transposase [Enterococcus sp. PFB1-1]MDH6400644.1 transposase [Enterococcus sp. PF1-24]